MPTIARKGPRSLGRYRNLFLPAALCGCLLLPGATISQASEQTESQRELPDITVRQLDRLIETEASQEHLPGVAVGIWIPGQGRYVLATGEADLATHSARTLSQPFRIASITKTFVGTVILQLADRGLLKVTDPISRWFPGFPQADITTVDDLLRMRSGIPDTLEQLLPLYYAYPLLPVGADDEIALAAAQPGLFKTPDQETVYANINFVLLQRISELVTGKPFPKLLQAMIVRPLGLHHTTYPTDPVASRRSARLCV